MSYTQLGTGTSFNDSAAISAAGLAPTTQFIESGTGKQVSASDLIAASSKAPAPAVGAPNPLPAPMVPTPIGTPVSPPSGNGAPTPPPANAPSIADQFHTSLASTLSAQQEQLQASLKAQTDTYQKEIDKLDATTADAQNMEELGLASEGSTVRQETAEKRAALDQYQKEYQSNFDARQKLTDNLKTLLDTGQSIITGLKNTSGLSSIMNVRISNTMTDVQGQAGVIATALAAYDSQIGLATQHLNTTVDAITSIYNDQISYWKNVVSFYSDREKTSAAEATSLSKDQKTYIDAQIKELEDKVSTTQATAKTIQDAMLDPTKALAYAKAGVSLTDTPEQISQKLALQAKADQNVWGEPKLIGGDYVQVNKLTGETRTVVSNVAGNGGAPQTAAERQAAQLQAYSSAFVPGATLKDGTPIIDSNGYATPAAWKQAIADYPGDRADFIKKYGYLLFAKGGVVDSKYGLTAQEQKLITG